MICYLRFYDGFDILQTGIAEKVRNALILAVIARSERDVAILKYEIAQPHWGFAMTQLGLFHHSQTIFMNRVYTIII